MCVGGGREGGRERGRKERGVGGDLSDQYFPTLLSLLELFLKPTKYRPFLTFDGGSREPQEKGRMGGGIHCEIQ